MSEKIMYSNNNYAISDYTTNGQCKYLVHSNNHGMNNCKIHE